MFSLTPQTAVELRAVADLTGKPVEAFVRELIVTHLRAKDRAALREGARASAEESLGAALDDAETAAPLELPHDPPVVSSRAAAGALLQDVPEQLADTVVVTFMCRDMAYGSASFAGHLIQRLVVERDAGQLVFRGAPANFAAHVRAAAESWGVSGRCRFVDMSGRDIPAPATPTSIEDQRATWALLRERERERGNLKLNAMFSFVAVAIFASFIPGREDGFHPVRLTVMAVIAAVFAVQFLLDVRQQYRMARKMTRFHAEQG